LLLITSVASYAQETLYSVPIDTLNKSKQYIPTGLTIGVELLGPSLYFFDNRVISYEGTIETDISNYSIMVEGGHQEFAEVNNNVDYSMSGNFLRLGPNVNFLKTDRFLNSFSFGLRYTWSSFDEKVIGIVKEDNWGEVPVNFDIKNNKSQWVEMTTGVKVRLWKGLFTGYIFRFRFVRWGSEPDVPFDPYYVPGYGLADRTSTWGFRYYVLYRFQWARKPIPVKKK